MNKVDNQIFWSCFFSEVFEIQVPHDLITYKLHRFEIQGEIIPGYKILKLSPESSTLRRVVFRLLNSLNQEFIRGQFLGQVFPWTIFQSVMILLLCLHRLFGNKVNVLMNFCVVLLPWPTFVILGVYRLLRMPKYRTALPLHSNTTCVNITILSTLRATLLWHFIWPIYFVI